MTNVARPAPVRGSIVIPAWNEAGVIERTLSTLFDGLATDQGTPTVVVAANGCTDDTVTRVEVLGLPVTILDLPPIGKAGAIRAAERITEGLPRLYLDADTSLPGAAANAVLDALAAGAAAARPPVRFDLDGATWPVRCFYRARSRLPSVSADLCGAGIYGVSQAGRSRFAEIPDVSGDDLFVARHFGPGDVVIVPCEPVVVRPPRTARSLVRTLRRVYRGNRRLAQQLPDLAAPTTGSTVRELTGSVHSTGSLVDAIVYAALVTAGRFGSGGRGTAWERDDTGRAA